ncbi:hypothetical protein [Ornithinimicrobium faecis]|uniref:hypothetical protein n=1 Tax=Ornithinimicrobium faecis TaxID=2934158 RepID=UPI0021191F44|nr:hypothetical protein [Ornithinimicrobium sp. HY1745]
MIPTLIMFGLIFGRWWKTSLVIGSLGWPVLLVVSGIDLSGQQTLEAIGLGLLNTLVGIVVHQVILHMVRAIVSYARRRDQGHV